METSRKTYATIDEYIADFPEEIREILQKIRSTIRAAAPGATEKISYQMPTFYLEGNLVHFAAFKHHIGFYPTPSGIEEFVGDLEEYQTLKGAIQFPLDRPIPYDLFARITAFRVRQDLEKAQAKKKK